MGEWKHGLFGCFDNFGICIMTWLLPCITVGKTAEKMGESCFMHGFCTFCVCGIYMRAIIRGKIREQRGIEGSLINDIIMHWICAECAIIQEAQELDDGGMARE